MREKSKTTAISLRPCAEPRYQIRMQKLLPGGSCCSSSTSCIGSLADVLTVSI